MSEEGGGRELIDIWGAFRGLRGRRLRGFRGFGVLFEIELDNHTMVFWYRRECFRLFDTTLNIWNI